jgi:hypothetical protein
MLPSANRDQSQTGAESLHSVKLGCPLIISADDTFICDSIELFIQPQKERKNRRDDDEYSAEEFSLTCTFNAKIKCLFV